MHGLAGVVRAYAWGSPDRIPEFVGRAATAATTAELWFGAHPSAPSPLRSDDSDDPDDSDDSRGKPARGDLRSHIAADPHRILGSDVTARFGTELPYLLKLIAPESPLSLQVHPNLAQARDGHRRAGLPGGPQDYVDANHKPELVYALSTFEAVSGFRAPRRAAEMFAGLSSPLAREIVRMLRHLPPRDGARLAFRMVLTEFSAADVGQVVADCADRLARGSSPSQRSDATVVRLGEHFPGDPGVVAALLLNPVTLKPGEVMFVPAGSVHAYLGGLGLEIMANSDNVLRAGLTGKNVDLEEMLAIVDYTAAPPIRLAAEEFGPHVRTYYAPVDDFELSVIDVTGEPVSVPGKGPRILLAIEGAAQVHAGGRCRRLERGEAVFLAADDGPVTVAGAGGRASVVQADVP
ncbi:mannose-6-phosphate isomerase, class I [Pseudactinotalea sp. HY160]|uniref:mannose-6-phosphate isomerase, class I n=1 Tax=Pseudactinotalea sp. HY160 TaxID=2654490 RepID=UPI00128E131B|nr:mannose-6-phosphate isomerase, class I [Pseudactinotalea sp. HY160]MPV48857.1 mannose-6-phosphate isomerase, class I [Pseudactinotalea sp. HY160]